MKSAASKAMKTGERDGTARISFFRYLEFDANRRPSRVSLLETDYHVADVRASIAKCRALIKLVTPAHI